MNCIKHFFGDDKDLRSYVQGLQHSPSAEVALTANAFIAKNYMPQVRTLDQELDEFISEIDIIEEKQLWYLDRRGIIEYYGAPEKPEEKKQPLTEQQKRTRTLLRHTLTI